MSKKKIITRKHIVSQGTVLYNLAIKCGFTKEQITGFSSEEELKEAVRRVKPGLIAEMEAGYNSAARKSLPKEKKPELKDKVSTFNVGIDQHRTVSAVHASMEEMQIQSELRAKHIKNIQSISIVRSLVPDKKGMLNSQVTVNYKG